MLHMAAWINRVRWHQLKLMVDILRIPAEAVISFVQWTNRRRLKTLTNAIAGWHERTNSVMPELQILSCLTEYRKSQVLAARSVLLDESKRLQMFASTFESYRAPGVAVLMYTLEYLKRKSINRKRKSESLERIISRVDSDTFYWDLLLWLVLPGASGEDALGDLNEEYLLRNSTEGEARARAWYRTQAVGTLKDCFWEKVVRLAALGTLIDLVGRWFRS